MFDNKMLATIGIKENIEDNLQQILWTLAITLKDKGVNPDYLQIFNLESALNEGVIMQKITHKQEEPEYEDVYFISSYDPVNATIYIIDDSTHSTMLFSNEY